MNWNDIKYFLAVARALSLTDAARELQVTQSTVARRLAALEESLGASLFLRRPDGYKLTERGAALIGVASEAEAYLYRIQREAAVPIDAMTGTVRVALPELLGQQLLIPSFATFLERYPDIHLEFFADVRPEKLTTSQDDVLLRLVQPTHGDYYVRRIGSIVLGLYCSPDYVERHGLPRRDADFGAHRLIGWDQHLTYLPLARWMIDKAPNAVVAVRTNSMSAQLMAAAAGMGIAVLPAIVARRHGLIRALGDEEPFQSGLWLLQHADTRRSARVEAVSDHLSSFVKSHAAELESAE